jgi:hypothetical protein
MKKINLILLMLLFAISANSYAQDNLKYYTYSTYISSSTFNNCTGEKVVYFSPITNYTLKDDYRISDEMEIEGAKIARRWENKIEANYNINKDYCYNSKTSYWEKSYNEIDSVRDEWIKFYKDQGYKVYSNYTFGFR